MKRTIVDKVKRARELFEDGQRIMEAAVARAGRGESFKESDDAEMRVITIEIRKTAKHFEDFIRGFRADDWIPWQVSKGNFVSEFYAVCKLHTEHSALDVDEIARFRSEALRWFDELSEYALLESLGPTKRDAILKAVEMHNTGSTWDQVKKECEVSQSTVRRYALKLLRKFDPGRKKRTT